MTLTYPPAERTTRCVVLKMALTIALHLLLVFGLILASKNGRQDAMSARRQAASAERSTMLIFPVRIQAPSPPPKPVVPTPGRRITPPRQKDAISPKAENDSDASTRRPTLPAAAPITPDRLDLVTVPDTAEKAAAPVLDMDSIKRDIGRIDREVRGSAAVPQFRPESPQSRLERGIAAAYKGSGGSGFTVDRYLSPDGVTVTRKTTPNGVVCYVNDSVNAAVAGGRRHSDSVRKVNCPPEGDGWKI